MISQKFYATVVQLCLIMVLTQCSEVGERRAPVVRMVRPAVVKHGGYELAYQRIKHARKLEEHAPAAALNLYLEAAKMAYQSRDKKLLPLYNHAVGQVADLVVQLGSKDVPVRILRGGVTLNGIDDVIPADCLKLRGWRKRVSQQGVGAPIVVRSSRSGKGARGLFVAHGGLSYAATAVLKFPAGKLPVLRCYDPNEVAEVDFWGGSHTLAHDLTSPLAVSLKSDTSFGRETLEEWFGVFVPMRFVKKMGLYMTSPFDPGKIPVVLVHGLKSDPVMWRNAINELNADPVLRKRYQFMAFYYPTGLPLRVPAAELKRKINMLHGRYVKAGKGANAQKMVIIGHSLGGLLTSVQVRKIDKNISSRVFKTPRARKQMNPEALRDFQYILHGPEPRFVSRVVFIATPHRGSRHADYYVSRLISSLVEIPKNLLTLKPSGTTTALTDFGRSLMGGEKKESSLSLLQSHSATLKLLVESPIYQHIKYHSIIGDRGHGDTPNSSDGIVDYASSHLKGAASEKIVPSGHSAENNPEAIQELRRILRLNLRGG